MPFIPDEEEQLAPASRFIPDAVAPSRFVPDAPAPTPVSVSRFIPDEAPSQEVNQPSTVMPAADPLAPAEEPLGLQDTDSKLDRDGNLMRMLYQESANPVFPSLTNRQAKNVGVGIEGTVASILKAPGAIARVGRQLNAEPAEGYRWTSPVSSLALMLSDATNTVEKAIMPTPDPAPTFEDQVMQGAGSAAAFMTGGAVGKLLELPAWAVTGGLGATVGLEQQVEDAVAHGATPDQQMIAGAGGAVFGATEALPGAWFLGKLNKLSGGKIAQKLMDSNWNGESGPVREIIKGFFVEGGQEGAQQVGQNWVAEDLAGYDPTRLLGENFWNSFVTGGLVGSAIGGATGLMYKSERDSAVADINARYRDALATGDPINAIGGGFTPVQDLVNLNKVLADIETNISLKANMEPVPSAPVGFMSPRDTGDNPFLGTEAATQDDPNPRDFFTDQTDLDGKFLPGIGGLNIDRTVEKDIPLNEDGTEVTVRQALIDHDVVAANSNIYGPLLQLLDSNIRKKELQNFAEEQSGRLSADEIKRNGAILNMMKQNKLGLMAKDKIVKTLLKNVKEYSVAFKKLLGEDSKLVVMDGTDFAKIGGTAADMLKKRVEGFYMLVNNVELSPGKMSKVGMIYTNLDKAATEIYTMQHDKKMVARVKRQIFETINHELGHGIMANNIQKLQDRAMTGDGKSPDSILANDTLKLLAGEYRRWLQKASISKQSFLLLTQFAVERAQSAASGQNFDPQASMSKLENKDYYLNFDEFFAEMTSRLATQGEVEGGLTKFFTPVLKQYQELFQHLPAFSRSPYGHDYLMYLKSLTAEARIKDKIGELAAGGGKDIFDALRTGIPGFDPKNFAGLRQQLDKWNSGMSWGLNLLQIAKENPHIPHLGTYISAITQWQEYQRNFQFEAVDTMKAWRALGKKESGQVSEVLFEEAVQKSPLSPVELGQRLTNEGLEVYKKVRTQLNRVLEEMEREAVIDATATFYHNSEMRTQEVEKIKTDFAKMRSQGYFPFVRFGKHTVTVRARKDFVKDGTAFKKGEIVSFTAFEDTRERDAAAAEVRRELGDDAAVSTSVMKETDFVMQGMPRSLLRSLANKLELTGDMTDEIRGAIDRAQAEVAPFGSFRKHFLKKKGVHGYSEDAMRSFAHYVRNAAGHISRVKFGEALREPLKLMQQDVELIKETGGRADERQEMKHWMDRHFSYIMNPANELAALRAFGFVAYLGFNIKSASVNLLQTPTIVYPYLAARYGDLQTVAAMTKATKSVGLWVGKRERFLKAAPESHEGRLLRMIEAGKHEGWLDQSLATEIAIAASENNLDRGLHLPTGRRFWHNVSRWSALPFQVVEKLNRYVTAVAAYDLEFQRTGDHKKSVLAARLANWSANYENARWNRPRFMQGKKSAAFLFSNYVQNTLYFALRDQGKVRYLLMMLLLGGLLAIPGADDAIDLADFAATVLNRKLGIKDPKISLRRELRDRVEELGANPDLVLHGLSQDTFGLGQVGELTGLPIPHLDLSRSISISNIFPLTEIPNQALTASPEQTFMQSFTSASGASGNLVEDFYRNLLSNDPNDWKRAEKILPIVAAKNIMKATRLFMGGEEKTQSGSIVAEFDPHDMRDKLELVGQAFGYTPSKMNLGWERELAQRDYIAYYKVQSEALHKQFNWALMQEDREALADVREAIQKYNGQVPYPEMGIGTESLKQSSKGYLEKQALAGAGVAAERKNRRLQQRVRESYPDPYGDNWKKEPQGEGASP